MAERRPTLTSLPTVFVDSSVFFTAVNSPTGGSAKIFSLNESKFRLVTSPVVLTETERNVRKKLLDVHLERFLMLAKKLEVIKQTPKENLVNQAEIVIIKKDAVILAEAKQTRSDYLLTLDVKHFKTEAASKFVKPTEIVTPKELLSK